MPKKKLIILQMKKLVFIFLSPLFLFVSCLDDTQVIPDDIREDISIKWLCTDNDGENVRTYEVTVTNDTSSETKVVFDNFHNFGSGTKVSANINGSSITIPKQNVEIYSVSGSGQVSSNLQRIELTYVLDDRLEQITITAVCTPAQVAKKALAVSVISFKTIS